MEIKGQQWDDKTEYLWPFPEPEMSPSTFEPF